MTCSVGEAVVQTFVVTEQKEVRNQGAYQMVGGAVTKAGYGEARNLCSRSQGLPEVILSSGLVGASGLLSQYIPRVLPGG